MKHDTASVGRVFKIIRDRGPLAASDIVRMTGLAKSTVSVNVDRLLETGLVREEASPGAKRKKLKVAERAGFVVGVDIGQTHLAVGICDLEAVVLDSTRLPLELSRESPEPLLERLRGLIVDSAARLGIDPMALFGIGVGVPGPVDFARGIPVNPPVMPGWDRFPVAAYLSERFGCPVFLDNDANVMALGERERGAAQNADNFMFVKIGTGIGAGLVFNGELYRGAKGAAGDIGHIGIDGDQTLCRCGNIGCLEALAGGAALKAKAVQAASEGRSPFLAERIGRGELIDSHAGFVPRSLLRGTNPAYNPSLAEPTYPAACCGGVDLSALALGAAAGDEVCVSLLVESGRAVGNVLAKLVNFVNPSTIVVGGGLAVIGERYIASIREAVYRRSTPLATSDLVVKKSLLGQECGVVGAAVLVLDEILSHRNVSKIVGGNSNAPKP